jgi:glucuronoarabinoxylan endo-1,4-beta-xylanase
MKKFLPCLTIILLTGYAGLAQTPATSFETDFSSGAPTGTWYDWVGEMTITYENEEMKVVINRTLVNSWDRLAFWLRPFDIGPSPFFSMRIRSDQAMPLSITFKDTSDATINYDVNLTGNDEWDEIFLNITDDLGNLNYPILAEMQFDPNPGTALQATLYIDDVKVGDAAKPDLSPPTIDPVANLLVDVDAGLQTVQLDGISDGGDGGQNISVEAVSDNTDLIPSPTVNYTSPDSTGTLSFTPAAGEKGEATITVTVTDDGIFENQKEITFKVLVMEYGGDGFSEDFEAAEIDSAWDLSNADYSLSQSAGMLHINAHKNAGWESFTRNLDGFYDFSANPFLNLDVKGSKPLYVHVYLTDVEDNTAMEEVRVMQSDRFVTTTFDFSGTEDIKLDQVTGLIFAFNGYALNFDGDVWFDNLEIGSAATRMAYMGAVPDQHFYFNSGSHGIQLTDIQHASGITADAGGSVVENLMVSAVSDGLATLDLDIIADSTGTDTITLTLAGETGFDDYAEIFTVSVEENAPPEIDQADNLVAAVGQEITVDLSGISDGNPNDEQEISITAASSDTVVIPEPVEVEYTEGPYASITFTPDSTGTAEITVSLTDDGGGSDDSASMSFSVEVFTSLNNTPTVDPVDKLNIFNDAGETTVPLTGISDGDGGSQSLTISAVSSVDTIVPNPVVVEYTGGDTALLRFTPDTSNTGTTSITVKIVDDGGTPENNGNDSVMISFEVETRVAPLTGWVVPLGEGDPHDYFSAEQEGVVYFLSYVDSAGFSALQITMENKWEFGGIWMDMPQELDLTDYPYISYDVYPVGSTLTKTVDGVTESITDTYHWNYFYDVNGDRNILNSSDHMLAVPPDQWTTLSFDYSDPGDMLTSDGEEILNNRISDVLFNLHWRKGMWPFTDMSGTILYRNIRIGDKAVIPPKTPVNTIDGVSTQAVYVNSGEHTVVLSGISNGRGSVEGVTLEAYSGRQSIVPDPVLGDVLADGTATLTFTAGAKTGSSPMNITVKAEGSDDMVMRFNVNIVSDDVASSAQVNVDRTLKFQTIEGLGTFENERRWIDLYATDLGSSAVRIGLIGNQIEPENDNEDPHVLDMESLNYGAIDFDYFRMLKDAGVETFILTSWSPPAWMKKNLSLDWLGPNAETNSDAALNRLEYHYYDEFAESMVAVVKMFEQEAGIHLEAIGLQNEPAFDEPYSSAILDLEHFAELIEVVGKRFEEEGITTRLYMPEQVVGQNNNSNAQYLDALQDNAEANPYCDIFAVHGYGEDGITPGTPSYSEWKTMLAQAQQGDYPKKIWMTETHIGYQDWNSAMSTAGAIHGGLWAGNIGLWTNWSFGDMQLTKNEPNSTFYTSKNYFKYIRPGAIRVDTYTDIPDILATAFEHDGDGTFTVVLINKGNNPVSVELAGSNLPNQFRSFRTSRYENFLEVDTLTGSMFILPGSSVTTLYATENPALTIDDVPNLSLLQNDPEQTVNLTGISDGKGGTASLTLSAETSAPDLITGLAVSAVQADGTAALNFTPGTDLTGTAQITISLTDGTETRELKFYVVVKSTVSTGEVPDRSLKVFPNPASEKLWVEIPEPGLKDLVVTDITGRILLRRQLTTENLISIDLSAFSKGIYLVTLGNEQTRYRARFIVR